MELFGNDMFGQPIQPHNRSVLADEFVEPPFSVLDGRTKRWMVRKTAWKNQLSWSGKWGDGKSIFDPVLCEIIYKWFCPVGGWILDPFAGTIIRGGMAHMLGYNYYGIELRADLVDENYTQAYDLFDPHNINWREGDALTAPMIEGDFLFSCPPYGNLEVYSDDLRDLSNMRYDKFIDRYNSIIDRSVKHLRGEYAVFVVSNFRHKHNFYHDLVGDTIRAFESAGMGLYNDIVYLTPLGDAMMIAKKYFSASKKVVKVHQNVLVFRRI